MSPFQKIVFGKHVDDGFDNLLVAVEDVLFGEVVFGRRQLFKLLDVRFAVGFALFGKGEVCRLAIVRAFKQRKIAGQFNVVGIAEFALADAGFREDVFHFKLDVPRHTGLTFIFERPPIHDNPLGALIRFQLVEIRQITPCGFFRNFYIVGDVTVHQMWHRVKNGVGARNLEVVERRHRANQIRDSAAQKCVEMFVVDVAA